MIARTPDSPAICRWRALCWPGQTDANSGDGTEIDAATAVGAAGLTINTPSLRGTGDQALLATKIGASRLSAPARAMVS